MIIEDLLWVDDVSPLGLPPGYRGALEGSDVLQECEIADVRVCGVAQTVGVIFDARAGLMQSVPWAETVDTAVLVVRGVTWFETPEIRDALVSWDVVSDERNWGCRMGQVVTPGQLVIRGCGANLYLGRVPGLPDAQPLLGSGDAVSIRSGWPTWGSKFEVTIEPEHANPHLIGGYIHSLLAGRTAGTQVGGLT
ncbi:MAG: hypothetical protein FWD75_00965 [Propionibacteriaceae bacterium]|nr:hypothetical protein [Propionibacteriaceae bacterium]